MKGSENPSVSASTNEEVSEKLANVKLNVPDNVPKLPNINADQESSSYVENKCPAEDFVSTILESTSRLTIHNTDFIKKLMSKGKDL